MELIHTLLFFIRTLHAVEDLATAAACLKSLELSRHKTVVVYNQGLLSNEDLTVLLSGYSLDCHVIGDGQNVGTALARQRCFEYIWNRFGETKYISEIHLDMLFAENWEDPLTDFLQNNDEPLISCGIVDKSGKLPFLEKQVAMPPDGIADDAFLKSLRQNTVMHGFTCPCIHVSEILKKTGGYDTRFLKGMQCYEDDSMLLGYYYYYGTRQAWYPKISFASVVYHAVAGQRLDLYGQNIDINHEGLVKQYGAMGQKHLSELHKSLWHKLFFSYSFDRMIDN